MLKYLVLTFVVICGVAECARAPFITPCHRDDFACLKISAQKALPIIVAGIPDFGIVSVDPMYVEQIKTSQAGLDMDFRNTSVTGLSHSKVLSLKRIGSRTLLDLKCSLDMVGDYTLGGNLLTMSIEGNGNYTIKIREIIVKIVFQIGEKVVDGDRYWTVNKWKYSSEVPKAVRFQFKNLFNGMKALSDLVHQFANAQWRIIFQEVAPPIVKAIVAQALHEIIKFFEAVPIKEIILI